MKNSISLNNIISGNKASQFALMAGPCAIENEETPFLIAEKVKGICQQFGISYIFKGSYRKANRSRIDSFTGIGDLKALNVLKSIGETFEIPVVTDIHAAHEAEMAAEFVDILQIPAFLCRQTDLLLAAANTGKIVNVKKGQFLSGEAMRFAVEKIKHTGNEQVLLTERGNMYGYQDMIVDFRNINIMQQLNVPVFMDITHSLQQPNQASGVTGGKPELIGLIAKAAIAVGADGLFIETHPKPAEAKSDGANMLQLDKLEPLLEQLVKIRESLI